MRNLLCILVITLAIFLGMEEKTGAFDFNDRVLEPPIENSEIPAKKLEKSKPNEPEVKFVQSKVPPNEGEGKKPNWYLIGALLVAALEVILRFIPKARDITIIGLLYELLNKVIGNRAKSSDGINNRSFKIKSEEDK